MSTTPNLTPEEIRVLRKLAERLDREFTPERGRRGRRHEPFNIPPGRRVRTARDGTKRARLVKMLLSNRGATLQDVLRAIPRWTPRLAMCSIRALDRLGYGLKEDERGRMRLVEPKQ